MASRKFGGIIELQVNGVQYLCKGSFTAQLGNPKREDVIGSSPDGSGFKETNQLASIEGEITDQPTFSISVLQRLTGQTVIMRMANGKSIVLDDAWFSGDGTVQTEEGNIAVKFSSAKPGQEV